MAFLRSENKRLAMDNEALKAALKQRNRDIEEVEARFMRECMECELRKAEKPSVYEQIMQGLQEVVEYEKGERQTLGERIRELRKGGGMTQKQLAEMCGTYDSAIRKYETGKNIPRVDMIRRLSDALGVTLAEMLEG